MKIEIPDLGKEAVTSAKDQRKRKSTQSKK